MMVAWRRPAGDARGIRRRRGCRGCGVGGGEGMAKG